MNDMMVFTMEMDNVKRSFSHAISDHNNQINSMIKESVDKLCTVENIQNIINNKAEEIVKSCVEQSIKDFYMFGPGRTAIKKLVEDHLGKDSNDNQKFK